MADSSKIEAFREAAQEQEHKTRLKFVDTDLEEIATRSGNGLPVPEVGDVVDFAEGDLFSDEEINSTEPYEVLERQISYGQYNVEAEIEGETVEAETASTLVLIFVEETTLDESFTNVNIR